MPDELKPVEATTPTAATTEPVSTTAEAPVKTKARGAKKKKFVTHGHIYIQATYNNTIVTVADTQGNVLAWSSAGKVGFRGPKKSTPYAAGLIVRDVMDRVKPMGLKDVDVFVRGIGLGREAAVRAIGAQGVNVISIKDQTPIPHNGPRPPKVRRV